MEGQRRGVTEEGAVGAEARDRGRKKQPQVYGRVSLGRGHSLGLLCPSTWEMRVWGAVGGGGLPWCTAPLSFPFLI